MFDILFSFNFVWIALVIIVLSIALAFACAFLHRHFQYVSVAEWLTEHVYCPLGRVLLLVLMVFLLYPLMIPGSDYAQLWALFSRPPFQINMINILFVAGLLFSFLPIVSHPAVGMPLLGCIATALFFKHQYAMPNQVDFTGFPAPLGLVKIAVLILIAYWLTRWLNRALSQWVDLKFMVSDSENLISDINYLIFQMPIVLAYGQALLPR